MFPWEQPRLALPLRAFKPITSSEPHVVNRENLGLWNQTDLGTNSNSVTPWDPLDNLGRGPEDLNFRLLLAG